MADAAALRAHLVAVRRGLGISQAEVAARLGVTQTAVSYWESGNRQVSLDDYVAWAAALGVEIGPVNSPVNGPAQPGPAIPAPRRTTAPGAALGDVTLIYAADGTVVGGLVNGEFRPGAPARRP